MNTEKLDIELRVCRKVRYGNNGNFVRYVPLENTKVDIPKILDRALKQSSIWTRIKFVFGYYG